MSFANRFFLSLYCSAPIIKHSDLVIFLNINNLPASSCARFAFLLFGFQSTRDFSIRPFSILLNTEYHTQFLKYNIHCSSGGLKWIRTTDLALIRRAL